MAFEDFWLDPSTGDLSLNSNGRVLGVDGAQRIRQHCNSRIMLRKGEYFLDEEAGVDYLGVVLVKNPDPTAVRAAFVEELLAVEGVARVTRLDYTPPDATRLSSVSWEAVTVDGITIGGTV